jgi:hypothetical protein
MSSSNQSRRIRWYLALSSGRTGRSGLGVNHSYGTTFGNSAPVAASEADTSTRGESTEVAILTRRESAEFATRRTISDSCGGG